MGNIEITPELLEELKDKAKVIKQGLWVFQKDGSDYYPEHQFFTTPTANPHGADGGDVIFNTADNDFFNVMDFIAAANPAVMLALIAKIEQLEKEADWLAARLQTICKHDVPDVCAMLDITKCPFFPGGEILMKDERIKCKCEPTNWRNAAKEAVKDNEQADK